MGRKRKKAGRGCLCKDEPKYSLKCCKDEDNIYAQRVGKIYFEPPIESFLLIETSDNLLLQDSGKIII